MATIHIDTNIGVSGTKIHWMRSADGKQHWCRMAISLFGMTETDNKSPFDKQFNCPFVEGKGATKDEALENMNKDLEKTTNALWEV